MDSFKVVTNKSSVWRYFKKHLVEDKALCIDCSNIIKCNGGSTSGLRNHLKAVHKIELQKTLGLKSSPESERAFSSACYFCSKLRSRLNDDSLDKLCFFRSYFQKNC